MAITAPVFIRPIFIRKSLWTCPHETHLCQQVSVDMSTRNSPLSASRCGHVYTKLIFISKSLWTCPHETHLYQQGLWTCPYETYLYQQVAVDMSIRNSSLSASRCGHVHTKLIFISKSLWTCPIQNSSCLVNHCGHVP
jgi:hypothetical protein